MNNIYVEGELPDNCKTCQYKSIGRCVLSDKNVFDYMVYETSPEECPVKPLPVRLKEERKKVVQEIREPIIKSLENGVVRKNPKSSNTNLRDIILFQMLDILDQIERGV